MSSFLCFHYLNTSATITSSIISATILSRPTTLPPNNIVIFPTWYSSINSSHHTSKPSMYPMLFNSACLSHSNSLHNTKCEAHPLLLPYHTTHFYPPHRAHISSCQQTSLLYLTSSWTSTWLPPDLVPTQCMSPTWIHPLPSYQRVGRLSM